MFYKYFLILLCFANSLILLTDPPEPSGRRLRIIVADKYPDHSIIIGGTTGAWALGTDTGCLLDREFSYVTPENDFKQQTIHPNPSTWNWTRADKWIRHIADHQQILRMHCPIGPQCSVWAKDDSRTPEQLETNLREFLTAVCQRYNGKLGIKYMDVVNETVVGGDWNKNKPGTDHWECPWYIIGQDTDKNKTPLYIKIAFEIAQQYAPNIKLIYNQHGGLNDPGSWKLIAETIQYLREKGLRVDGIGWQAHVDNGWATPTKLNRLRRLIDWAHSNNLEFHITEASVYLKNGLSQEALEQQATTYRAIIEVLLEKRFSGKVGWNIWDMDDGHCNNKEWYPSLFDANYEAKPAYYAIQTALENGAPSRVDDNQKSPDLKNFVLEQNYPNPFNQSTIINYLLKISLDVSLKIYDVRGNKLRTLVDKFQNSGNYEVVWNGKDDSGNSVDSGVYFCQLKTANGYSRTRKLLLLK